jgi:hypothetical protein
MSKTIRGKRDGTGPFKGSFQETEFGLGKRKRRGEKCPFDIKKK